jgi:hypothetical protein
MEDARRYAAAELDRQGDAGTFAWDGFGKAWASRFGLSEIG